MTSPDMTGVTDPSPAVTSMGLEGLLGQGGGIEAVGAGVEEEVSAALLAAGRDLIEAFGIRRLRMDDVARRAGYGRATLYRRFATRDDLVRAVVTREIRGTLLDIAGHIAPIEDLRHRIVEAFAVTLERSRANPLMRRLLQIEPDLLLPHLTTGGAGALDIGRGLIISLLEEGRSRGSLRAIDVEITAELVVRVAHSMLLTPDGPVAIDDPSALREFARTFIADPLFRSA